MATALPPTTPQEEDERYNTAQQLADQEFNATTTPKKEYTDSGIDQLEAYANDPENATQTVREQEENPMGYEPEGNRQNASGSSQQAKGVNFGSILKKGGPAGLLTGVFGGVIALIASLMPLMPIHVYHSFLEKYDAQNTSYTIRLNKVIQAKLVDKNTNGSCEIVKVACRFSRPSNYMLSRMTDQGLTAYDKNGKKIEKTLIGFPNGKPATYKFDDGSGNVKEVQAKDFVANLKSDPKFRNAFHTANLSRLVTFSDSVFKRVVNIRFGSSLKDTNADAKNEKEVEDNLSSKSKGLGTGAEDAKTSEEAKKVIQPLIEKEASKEARQLARAGKTNAIGFVAGAVCGIADAPGIITRTARAYQLAQLIKFAVPVMVTINAMKAGDATPQEVTAVGNAMTAVVAGKTALDSFGMKYTLYGDTSTKSTSHKKFVPGGGVNSILGGVTTITDSDVKKGICAGATSPVTGLAINAILAPTTLGIGDVINIGIGFLASSILEVAGPPVISLILGSIPPSFYTQLMNFFFGDLTANLKGEDFGNALASGTANMYGQVANAGGNMPLTVEQAVAYNKETAKVNYAYAEEDRATHSPFDASNSNTMMGSIVDKLIPLYGNMGSAVSVLGSVGMIANTSISSALGLNAYAADDAAQYELCDDPSLTDIGGHKAAAGPFCNIQYGIPPQYLDMDSQQVVDDLVAAGQVNDETGEPIDTPSDVANNIGGLVLGVPEGDAPSEMTSLKQWMQLCSDGTSAHAIDCQITNKQTAEYAIYTIDHRIQKNLDNQDTEPTDDDGNTVSGDDSDDTLGNATSETGKVVIPAGSGYGKTDGWGPRSCAGCASFHTAQDFIGGGGGVYAATDGTVIYADKSQTANDEVLIRAANGVVTGYWHMYAKDILVSKGDKVTAGQRIGKMGCVGTCFGTHLHFEVDITDSKDPALKGLTTQKKFETSYFKETRTYAKPSEWFSLYGVKM